MTVRNHFAIALLVGTISCAGCQRSQSPEASIDASPEVTIATANDAKSKAMAAKDALFERLSGRLTEVMKAEGPAAAIEVCSREAAEMAKSVSEEHGVIIGRTSTKLRNPQNGPPEWVKPLIVEPKAEPQFVELPNRHTGALLPIKLQAKCITCHGPSDTIADDVKARLTTLYPDDQATGFNEGDLRGWFWIDVPAEEQVNESVAHELTDASTAEAHEAHELETRMGHGPGMGRGRGMMGRGPGSEMREDMTTLHAMFASRDKIKRVVKDLPDGAEATTESDDETIVALLQEHVPAMETRVHEDKPLPPMTFHPIFVNLIKHADDYTLTYEETDKGMKVTYKADDPFVIMLVQEHAKLVSRFIKNGMEEIHKPYTLPEPDAVSTPNNETKAAWPALPEKAESPEENLTTVAKVELGKKLLFDPRLSLTGTASKIKPKARSLRFQNWECRLTTRRLSGSLRSPAIKLSFVPCLTVLMELTATHQYQLHAGVLDDWGMSLLASQMRAEMQEAMGHSEEYLSRLMFLKGEPELTMAKTPVRSASLKEMFESDLADEREAIDFYTKASMQAPEDRDIGTRGLFEKIALDEEQHMSWLELQLDLLERMGEFAYISKYIPAPTQQMPA